MVHDSTLSYLAPAEERAKRDQVHARQVHLGNDKRAGHKRVSRAGLGKCGHFLDQLHHLQDDSGGEAEDEADVKVVERLVEIGEDVHTVAPFLDAVDDSLRPLALKFQAANEDASEASGDGAGDGGTSGGAA